jgi:flagellar motility protein MotE (MotC chaperone)
MTQIDAIEENVKLLRNDIKERKKRWIDFRSHIAQMTNISFDDFLNKKNSAGSVEFDHDNQQLNLIVQKVRADWLWIITSSLVRHN